MAEQVLQKPEPAIDTPQGALDKAGELEKNKRKITLEHLRKLEREGFDVMLPDPSMPTPYENENQLFLDVREFIKTYVELPEDVYYDVAALFALATWRVNSFDSATYLNLLAPMNSGKSRFLDVMQLLCRRSVFAGSGITKGALIRLTDGREPTLLLDETDNWLSSWDVDNPMGAALNAGYARTLMGGSISCELDPEGNYVAKLRRTFGFKIFAGRDPLATTLASRCIIITIRKTKKTYPKVDMVRGYQLREQLFQYCQNHHGDDPDIERLTDPDTAKISDNRIGQVFEPLLIVAPKEEIKKAMLQLAEETVERVREEELDQDEANIARAIIRLSVNKDLTIKSLTDTINLNILNPKEQYNYRTVGKITSRLGFDTKHTRQGARINLKPSRLEYIKSRYGEEEPVEHVVLPTRELLPKETTNINSAACDDSEHREPVET